MCFNAFECILSLQVTTFFLNPQCLSQISLQFCIGLEKWLTHDLAVNMTRSWNWLSETWRWEMHVFKCVCVCKFEMQVSKVVVQVCFQGNCASIFGLTYSWKFSVGDLWVRFEHLFLIFSWWLEYIPYVLFYFSICSIVTFSTLICAICSIEQSESENIYKIFTSFSLTFMCNMFFNTLWRKFQFYLIPFLACVSNEGVGNNLALFLLLEFDWWDYLFSIICDYETYNVTNMIFYSSFIN